MHQPEYENQYEMMMNKQMNGYGTINPNYTIGLSQSQQMQSALLKPQAFKYDSQEPTRNINFSLNQILGLPYQIVMPQTEINQSISINNLPSLNDLAIRTGINTGMSAIFASQRQMQPPSPVPMPTPQLILPLGSFYSQACPKDHLQLPFPVLDSQPQGVCKKQMQAKKVFPYYKQTPTIPSLRE